MKPALAKDVVAALVERGMFTSGEDISRVIIDLKPDHFVVLYVEYVGDERVLDVVRGLDGVEIKDKARAYDD